MLSFVLFLPLAGLLVTFALRDPQSVRRVALAASGLTLALSGVLAVGFDPSLSTLQFVERHSWLPQMDFNYFIGVDGLSLPLLLLTNLVGFVALLGSSNIKNRVHEYYRWFLLLQFTMMGVFLAQNWMLFYVFFELSLVPVYFIIGIWGGDRRAEAASTIFLYTLAGSILMLLSILYAYINSAGHSFDMDVLLAERDRWSQTMQIILFSGFLIGFAVKVPAFPFHGWLNLAHVEAPTPLSMVLSGVLLKMGGYGLMRVGELLPLAMEWFAPILLAVGFVNIVYGAILAWRQSDLKSMVAFSSISHMGFVLIGIASLTAEGFKGAAMQMVAHGIIASALFYLVGVIYYRTGTRDMMLLGGLVHKLPVYSALTIIALFASMGLPGLVGFIGEFHVLKSVLESSGLLVLLASVGIIVTVAYVLYAVDRVFMGPSNPKWNSLRDLGAVEILTAAPLVLLMIGLGLFPGLVLDMMDGTMTRMVALFS